MFFLLCFLLKCLTMLRFSWRTFKLLQFMKHTKGKSFDLEDVGNENDELQQARRLREMKVRVWKQSELQYLGQYFVVNAMFSTGEWFELFLGYIPFYYSFKFLMLLYLFFPQLKGSEIIYFEVILPQMEDQNIELFVDNYLEKMHSVSNVIFRALMSPFSTVVNLVASVLQSARAMVPFGKTSMTDIDLDSLADFLEDMKHDSITLGSFDSNIIEELDGKSDKSGGELSYSEKDLLSDTETVSIKKNKEV